MARYIPLTLLQCSLLVMLLSCVLTAQWYCSEEEWCKWFYFGSEEIIRLLTCASVCPRHSKTETIDRHALPRTYCSCNLPWISHDRAGVGHRCALYTAQGPTILTYLVVLISPSRKFRCNASSRPRPFPFTSFGIHSHAVTWLITEWATVSFGE